MADEPTQLIINSFMDGNGKTGTHAYHVETDTSSDILTGTAVAAITPVLIPMSAATLIRQISRTTERVAGTSAGSTPYTCRDKLALEFVDSLGNHRTWKFGAALQSVFVSPEYSQFISTATPGSTLKSVLTANMVDRAGGSYTYVRGYRDRSRRQRPGSKKFVGY